MNSLLDYVVQRSAALDRDQFLLARLGDGEEDHVLTRSTMPAGTFIPLHSHDDIESLSVLSGSLDVYRGDMAAWFTVVAGESIVVPPGVAHAIRNVADAPADVLAVMTVKLAAFVGKLGAMAAAAGRERTPEERARSLRALADDYGYWLALPSESEAIRHLPASSR